MSKQRDLLREIAAATSSGAPDRIIDWFTEDFQLHEPGKPALPVGHEGARQMREAGYVATVHPDPATFPRLMAHYQRMMARHAVQRTLEIEAAIGYNLSGPQQARTHQRRTKQNQAGRLRDHGRVSMDGRIGSEIRV
jgi:hypothetical protein